MQNAIQERALRTLKQKRMYESQLAQLTQQTFNMESAALATENLRNTMATVDAMKQANKELRKQYGKIDIDKIEVRVVAREPRCKPGLRGGYGGRVVFVMLRGCVSANRPCIMTWRTCWSRRTRSRTRSAARTLCLTRLTRRICKLVRASCTLLP